LASVADGVGDAVAEDTGRNVVVGPWLGEDTVDLDVVDMPLPKGAGQHVIDGGDLPLMVSDYADGDEHDEKSGPQRES
jgi:hypothetical protein